MRTLLTSAGLSMALSISTVKSFSLLLKDLLEDFYQCTYRLQWVLTQREEQTEQSPSEWVTVWSSSTQHYQMTSTTW